MKAKKLSKQEQLVQERNDLQQQIIELLGQGWEIVQEEFQRLVSLKGLTRNVAQITGLQSLTDDTKRILINAEYADYPLIHSHVSDVLTLPVTKMYPRLEQATQCCLENVKMLAGDSYDTYMELEGKMLVINTKLSKYNKGSTTCLVQ